jgi:DUF4097 and DUF4098 domain-containing protein YvlB
MAAAAWLGYGPDMTRAPDVAVSAVRVTTTSGAVTVTSDPDLRGVVCDGAPIEIDDSTATIEASSRRIDLRVPEGVDVVIGSTSGRVVVRGRVGSVAVVSTSGRVEIDDAASVDVRAKSGRVRIGRSRGETRVISHSGSVAIEQCGPVDVASTSGRISLREVTGPARAHCVSGRIEITMAEAHDVQAETISGRITISLPAGTRARLDTPSSGAVAGEHDCVVTARSGSGRVDVSTR